MKTELMTIAIAALLLTACGGTKVKNSAAAEAEEMTTLDRSYGGVDKSYDTTLLRMRDEIAPLFKSLTHEDGETGRKMVYNLFVPEGYDSTKQYPLVLFMADASTAGKSPKAPLMQGYGGIIWATPERQAEYPAFVLVPEFTETAVNDKFETSDEVGMARRLLDKVVLSYSIDTKRLYTTEQSMGGMISFYFNANYPDLFAASLFVGSQWDINVLSPLAGAKFFYIVSEGDPKASVGMAEVKKLMDEKGAAYG